MFRKRTSIRRDGRRRDAGFWRRLLCEPLESRTLLSAASLVMSEALLAASVEVAAEETPAAVETVEPQYQIKHSPRLQLGDAPLDGYAGSETDQIDILWQTISAGTGTEDTFEVEYRLAGDPSWIATGPIQVLDTEVETRLVHSVEVDGLDYDTDYEYRVRHLRDGDELAVYQETFHTRLPVADDEPFTFVAYGDSANIWSPSHFQEVQDRINQIDPAFAVLTGDNVYHVGTHADLDARFDPTIVPEATQWNAGHVDYMAMGNHDSFTDSGKPTEDNFSVPIPVGGVTAPASLPASERTEHNYSFDYGQVHFTTFDTTSVLDATRLDAQLDWVEADLEASDARWKIVFGHHPVAGVPDKSQTPDDNYYKQVVPRLRAAGVDLFLAGHSHTFSWTYPLLGESEGEATFVPDTDKQYQQGDGLIQVVSGVGGMSRRMGNYAQFPFVASGFTTTTDPASEWGFAQIDVAPSHLTVSYVAADDGQVIDQFILTAAPATNVVDRHVFYNNSSWDDPGKGLNDNDAVAPDKSPLLPGNTASFSNYTNYSRGINGLMVDITNLPGPISAADFRFKVGNDNQPQNWDPLAATPTITVGAGEGLGGSDRIMITFEDGVVEKQWLEVTVLANPATTGLAQDDVFYFGNAIGETGSSAAHAKVDAFDVLATRRNPRPFFNPASLETRHDFNRDRRVDAIDTLIAQNNQTWSLTELKLIDLSAPIPAARQVQTPAPKAPLDLSWLHQIDTATSRQGTAKRDKAVDHLLTIDAP